MGMFQFGLRLLVEKEQEKRKNSSAVVTCKPKAKYEEPHAALTSASSMNEDKQRDGTRTMFVVAGHNRKRQLK